MKEKVIDALNVLKENVREELYLNILNHVISDDTTLLLEDEIFFKDKLVHLTNDCAVFKDDIDVDIMVPNILNKISPESIAGLMSSRRIPFNYIYKILHNIDLPEKSKKVCEIIIDRNLHGIQQYIDLKSLKFLNKKYGVPIKTVSLMFNENITISEVLSLSCKDPPGKIPILLPFKRAIKFLETINSVNRELIFYSSVFSYYAFKFKTLDEKDRVRLQSSIINIMLHTTNNTVLTQLFESVVIHNDISLMNNEIFINHMRSTINIISQAESFNDNVLPTKLFTAIQNILQTAILERNATIEFTIHLDNFMSTVKNILEKLPLDDYGEKYAVILDARISYIHNAREMIKAAMQYKVPINYYYIHVSIKPFLLCGSLTEYNDVWVGKKFHTAGISGIEGINLEMLRDTDLKTKILKAII